MKEQLETRLNQLNNELERGQQPVQQLDSESTSLRETLLRISGAIQVIEEELERVDSPKRESDDIAITNHNTTSVEE